MSEGDVSLIRDEDVLRRMWQQTEDFSRKKEIRAHMYRLREERLRNLYSPEPTEGKGCEFTSTQGHVKSFADQSFQSMKSKEVRDAGSPPKEFAYRGQDLKDLSNAGWNVETENRMTDDGHTQVKSVHANIQGRYDVDGGKGQFTAADHHKQAFTEYNDGNSSLKRNEDFSNTSAHEQVVRQTDDGSHFSSTTSSSTSTSKFEQVSSKHETVPYLTNDDYDLASQKSYDTNKKEITSNRITKTNNYEQSLRNDYDQGELVSRKIDYPDDNTKVIVETRCLPDGTRVTSTRREFRAPSVQTSRSEHHSQQIRNESKSSSSYSSTQKRSQTNESSKIIRECIDDSAHNIVDSQRIKDDFDFRKEYSNVYDDNVQQQVVTKTNNNERDHREYTSSYDNHSTRQQDDTKTNYYTDTNEHNVKITRALNEDELNRNDRNRIENTSQDNKSTRSQNITGTRYANENQERIHHITRDENVPEHRRPKQSSPSDKIYRDDVPSNDDQNNRNHEKIREDRYSKDTIEHVQSTKRDTDVKEVTEKRISDQYQTTYQSDYAQRKISNEWSPTHQAWASTLRSDTPSRPTTRASSPGSKTFKSSDSSLRSSVSPDKNYRKTPSRGGSPNKIDRSSPMRTTSDRYSSTQSSTYSIHETRTNKYSSFDNTSPSSKSPTRQSPDRKPKDGSRQRPSVSPEKQVKTPTMRPSTSPQRKSSPPTDTTTPYKKSPVRSSPSPDRKYTPKESRTSTYEDVTSETNDYTSTLTRNKETTSKTTTVTNLDEDFNTTSSVLNKQESKSSESPDRQPGYMRHTASSLPKVDDSTPFKPQDSRKSPTNRVDSQSPERKHVDTKIHNVKEQHDTFIKKERQTYSNYDKDVTTTVVRESSPSQRKSPLKDSVPESQPNKDISTRKPTPSPDRKAPSERRSPSKDVREMTPKMKNDTPVNEKAPITPCSPRLPSRETSPVKRTMSPEKHTTKPHEREYSPTPAKSPSPSRKSPIDSNTYKKDTSPTRKSPTKDITSIKRSDVTDSSITKTSVIENTDKTSYEHDIKEKYTTSDNTNIKTNTDTITKIHKTKTVNDKPTPSVEPLSRSSPRRSTSPTKPLTKEDTKYKQTTEFITMERATEETDKRKANEHPRKLVTPSTSPTRKPKTDETAPSSGQSTPTTTASGFVYFGSPQVDKPIDTTDLDDKVTPSTDKPVNSDVLEKTPSRRTPSPTKIPSRSSPEKVVIKENLPRKSSLKKPSVDNSHTSPVEKPPTSFLISQNDVVKTVETKVTIDEPQKKDAPIKTKPPLERRETYEERCRKILGMTDDTTTEAEKTSLRSKQSISPETSPSISPCESPVQFEEKPFIKDAYETVDVVDISEETSVISEQKPNPETAGKYSRDNVNLQDINVHNTETHEKVTLSDIKVEDKTIHEQKSLLKTKSNDQTEKTSTRSPSKSPQRKSSYISPDRTSRKSPEKVQKSPTLDTPNDKLNKTDLNKKNTIDIYEEDIIKNAVDNQKDTNRTTQVTTKEHTIKEESTNFILSEREQQILDRVQSSLRKLSPDRNKKIPNQDKPESQCIITDTVDAATLSKNIQKETLEKTDDTVSVTVLEEKTTTTKNNLANNRPVSKSQIPSKPSSRNVSPNKKSPTSPNLSKATPVRSTSPKKPASPTEKKPGSPIDRPQSPQVPRTVTKTKEPVTTQKPSSVNEVKKVPTVKQHSTSRLTQSKISTVKTTTTTKSSEPEPKRINQLKGKTPDAKVTRTVSDIAMKSPLQKKVSPQRIKSKPEIQVTNVTSTKTTKQSNIRQQRPSGKESPTKLPVSKPKSAIDINTSMDDDDIIIDVQQAKSSRENSPDRICPTPVGFLEDTGTPRFPDEVNEPDDEFTKRTHNVIHETESIVDDIVEICEDDELFVRRNEYDVVDKKYESLLKVDDRVSKFTKRTETNKAEETSRFKNTEVRKHSDFIDENLKSDECLLSVSEKVNKFAKGPLRPKDKSPSRNIAEEFDKDTIYQDDYTKLSVNDKAHLFIETAENTKVTKQKPVQKPERPDLTNVDDSLKSDECLLSVSDKVNKFVKTAEQVLSDAYVVEEKERKIKEQHDKIMQQIVENVDDTITKTDIKKVVTTQVHDDNLKETSSPNERDDQTTIKIDGQMPKTKTTPKIAEKTPAKITTLRSSEAVKKAKALFENIATTTNKTKDTTKTAKLTDIGVVKKVKPSTDAVQSIKRDTDTKNEKQKSEHINIEYETTEIQETSRPRQKSPEIKSNVRDTSPVCRTRSPIAREKSPRPMSPIVREKSPINRTLSPMARDASPASGRKSPFTRPKTPRAESPVRRTQSPIQHVTTTVTKKVLSRFPAAEPASHKQVHPEDRPEKTEKVPGYQRPTKTSQMKEEKTVEEIETSSRRGSGKFGVELRRTSADRSSVSSERRRSSEHHQPCIEDIFDLDLLEQMLEKVVGYEQRRRIRAQIRVAKKRVETEKNTTITRTTKQTTKSTKTKSPERQPLPRSPDRQAKFNKPHSPERLPKTPHKTSSPDRLKITPTQNIVEPSEQPKQPLMNGHPKEPSKIIKDKETRPHSPDKHQKSTLSTPSPKTPRPSSPDKKTRPVSPSKAATPKSKSNRFSEYASAYMKKVGLNDSDKQKVVEAKTKKAPIIEEAKTRRIETSRVEHHSSKTYSERTSSKDIIEVIQVNGKKSPSPERCVREKSYDRVTEISHPRKESPERRPADKITLERKASPQRKSLSPERRSPDVSERITSQRSPSPDVKPKTKKETIIKTVVDIGKKVPQKQVQEEKPSWVTNRNLKKVTSETRTFSSKKIETEKPKYRASSPSKAITKPIDVITSSYGPGPLDADGRPLFGIKALRNGATNYQVKGTVIRQEFHSRNGGEPQGTVSVTAYSTQPEDLEKLLQTQGEKPSRLHGLAAITTTKKFGGDTGTTYSEVTTKEERAALDQFTHTDRKIQESKIERHSDTFDTKQSKQTIERITEGESDKKTEEVKRRTEKKESGRKEIDKLEKRTDKMQKTERRVDDRKTVRQSSVKSLTEKFIKNASETTKSERSAYPKAGLILRTTSVKDNVSESSGHAGLARTDSEQSLGSVEDVVTTREQIGDVIRTTTTTTRSGKTERSFLDSSTKVTGVQDILTRMKNADIVIEEGDSNEDSEARALLNKFLGATVLMAGMQSYVTERPGGVVVRQETVQTSNKARQLEDVDIEQCWDERVLRKLLDECTDYEARRRLRARIRTLMAEQEACASAVTEALAAAGETIETVETEEQQQSGERGESLLLPLLQGLLQGGGERLLAGLGTASHDVVADVRRSLQRLRLALAPPADHPQARALLALADRLEDALDAADRLDGCKRKTRRRSRTARHTVGVTREELEEARRMVDRDTLLPDPVKPRTTSTSSSAPSNESTTPERKQSVDDQVSYHDAIESRQKPQPVTHSVSYEPTPKVHRDVHVERRVAAPRKPDFFRHSIADNAAEPSKIALERWKTESKGGIAAIAHKFDAKAEKEAPAPIKRAPINRPQFPIQQKPEEPRRLAYRPLPPTYNFAAPPVDDTKPLNRSNSNSRRLRMKRANTIDIGRSYAEYNFDDENDSKNKAPLVPEFRPQTENDKKFLAFMQKNEENGRHPVGQANWSNRFGNIKNTFENREREENVRSSSASSAKRFWQAADTSQTSISRPRKFINDTAPEIVKPPWVSQRRDSLRTQVLPATKQLQQQSVQPPVPLSPTKPTLVKPFVARPIPVNQFSHAPMSAFKPPQKILSPTSAPPHVWSPPSTSMPVSPSVDHRPAYPSAPYMPPLSDTIKQIDSEKQRQVTGFTNNFSTDYNNKYIAPPAPKSYEYRAPTPPTHAHHTHNYPIQPIPSLNNLAAPQLVKKIDNTSSYRSNDAYPVKIDAQQLQIEFYEKQIREKHQRDASSERRDVPSHKPPAPPAPPAHAPYTIVDYTPPNSASTFIPLQQTPDIEKAKAHKVDYLPDVVINENNPPNYVTSPTTRVTPVNPSKAKAHAYQNGDDGVTTEHDSVVTKVMRGPVRGSATITAGVRTRGAADSLRGALDKLSSPKHDVISQIERKKREAARSQVRLAPPLAPGLSPHASPTRSHDEAHRLSGSRSPALAASRESIFSSESPASRGSSPGSALARSGSWHRFEAPKAPSPRKVVARTKSMHLLAVPKLYEGGISQSEVTEKKRTVEAYFSGQTSPRPAGQMSGQATGQSGHTGKVRARAPAQFALGRSRTMPAVSELQFLDESNADDAFEDLVSALA